MTFWIKVTVTVVEKIPKESTVICEGPCQEHCGFSGEKIQHQAEVGSNDLRDLAFATSAPNDLSPALGFGFPALHHEELGLDEPQQRIPLLCTPVLLGQP